MVASRVSEPKLPCTTHAPDDTDALKPHRTVRAHVRELLNSETYIDDAPATVYAKLLDAGEYHCSISTMYRILRNRLARALDGADTPHRRAAP